MQTIDIQPNLFWEDENRTPNIIEAADLAKIYGAWARSLD